MVRERMVFNGKGERVVFQMVRVRSGVPDGNGG